MQGLGQTSGHLGAHLGAHGSHAGFGSGHGHGLAIGLEQGAGHGFGHGSQQLSPHHELQPVNANAAKPNAIIDVIFFILASLGFYWFFISSS